MKMLGYLVVIKRSGGDGTPFPVVKTNCIIGRSSECDIRVQLPAVSLQQCQVDIDPSGKAYVTNLGQDQTTLVNDHQLAAQEVRLLAHRDVILIGERRLRWEYPADSPLALTQQFPETKSFRILTPTTKSPISRHNVEDNRGQKRSSLEASCMETPDAKKKRVSFGPNLNPEHFDKLLPPSAPVSKGEKPEVGAGVTESPLVSEGSTRKTKRVSTVPVIPEEPPCQETPTKSLLRRRSPTPVKPYLARSMGLQFLKALSDPTATASVSEHVPPEGKTSPPHQASVVTNTSPQKSSPQTAAAAASLSSKESSLSPPGKKKDEVVETRVALSPKVMIKKIATPDMTLKKLSSSPRKSFKAGTPKKVLGSISPRKISPKKLSVSPKSTPKKLSSPKSTPKKMPLPVPKDTDIPLSIPKKNKTPEKLATTPPKSSEQLVSVQAIKEVVYRGSPFPEKNSTISGSSSPLRVDGSPTRANISSPKTSPGKPEIDASAVSPIKETSPIKLTKEWSPSSPKSLRMSPESPWALKLSPRSPRALRLSPSSPDRLSVGINNTSPSFPVGFPKKALMFTPKSPSKLPKSPSSPQSERLKKTPQNIAKTPKRLKLTPKTTPKSALKISPSPKTLKTPKSSVNVSPKTPKSSIKASPKTPKSSIKSSPKTPKSSIISPKTPKSSIKTPKTPKSLTNASPKTPKSPVTSSPKTPKSLVKISPKTPKYSIKLSPKPPKSPKTPKTPQTSIKSSPKTPKSLANASPKTPNASLKIPKSSLKSSPKTPKSSVKSSPKTPKSPVNASSKTPKRTPTRVVTPKSKTPTLKVKTPESVKKIKTPSSRKVLTPSSVAKKNKTPGSAKKIQSPASAKKRNSTPGSTKKTKTPSSAAKRVVKILPLSPRGKKRKAEDTPLKKPIKKMKLAPATPATKKSGPSTSSVTKDKTPKKTPGKTPKKTPGKTTKKTPGKTPRKPSFADVLKKGLMKRGVVFSRSQRTHNQVLQRARLARAARTGNKNPTVTAGKAATALTKFEKEVPKTFKFGETSTTGHANSPASIFIGKKMSKTPRVFKRGRKTPLRAKTAGGVAGDEANFEGLAEMMATPGVAKMTTPKATRGSEIMEVEEDNATEEKEDTVGASPKLRWSPRTPSTTSFISTTSTTATNFTNFDFSAIKTPDITEDRFISPLVTPRPPSSTIPERISPRGCRGSPLLPTSPEDVPIEEDATTFDFENVHTPDVSQDAFVSPDSAMKPKMRRSLRTFTHGLVNLREEEKELESPSSKFAKKTPKINLVSASTPKPGSSGTNGDLHQQSSSESIIGMRSLFETITDEEEIEEEQADQTINNDSNSSNIVTRLSGTPTEGGDYTDVLGVRMPRSGPCTPEADYTQIAGVQKLMKTPKTTPQTPEADYKQVAGVKKLMKTPRASPKNTPKVPEADYTQVGVKNMMTTPRGATSSSPEADYTQVEGVRKLMKTPRATPQTPVADYTQVAGMKKLLKTPESNVVSTSPIADYTQVAGVRALLKTPKTTPETPEADYTQVAGVKKLMQTPKPPVPEHEADDTHLVGVRKVLRTPKPAEESPKADYTNVAGLRKLMQTPQTTEDKAQSLPSPDYSGIQILMRTPKSPSANLEENDNKYEDVGMKRMLRTPRSKEVETDYTQVQGNRKLLKTPGRIEKGHPLADYTDPKGLRNLLATPRTPVNSPEADYSNVHGLRALMRTPKDKKLVELDLQGLVQLVKTPLADQTNVVCSRVQTDYLKVQSPIASFPAGSRRKRKGTMTPEVQTVTPNAAITSSPSENIPPASIEENSKTGESDHTPRRSQRTRSAKNTSNVTPVRQVRSQHKKEVATPVDNPSVGQKNEHDEVISRTPTRKKLRNAGDGEPEDVNPRTKEEDNKQKQQEEKIRIPSPNVADEKETLISTHSMLSEERNSSPQAPSRLLPDRRCTRKNADLETPEETESLSSSSRPKRRTRKDAVLDKQDGLSASPHSSRRTKTLKEEAAEVATVDSLTPKTKVPSPDLLPGTKVTPHIVITPTSLRSRRKQPNNSQVEMVSEELVLTPSKRGRNRPNATPSSEARKGRSRTKKVDNNASVEEMQVELKKNVATPVADITTPVTRSRRPKMLKEEQEIVLESAEKCVSSAAATPVKRNKKGEEEEEETVKPLKREEEPKRSTRRKADSGLPEPPQKKRATRTRAGRQAAEEDIGEVKSNDETHNKETEEPPQKKTRVLRGRGKSKKATEEEEEEVAIVGNTAPAEDNREVETEEEETQPQKKKGRATRGKQKTTNKKVVEEQTDTEVEESNTEKEEEVQMQKRRGRPTRGRQQANKKVDESEAENKTVIQIQEEEETTASPHRASGRRLRNTTMAATSSPATPEITTRSRKSANKSTSKATSNKEAVDKEVAAATVEKNKLEEIPATRRTRGIKAAMKSEDLKTSSPEQTTTRATRATRSRKAVS
ncbi:hypothetical protein Pcinc_031286 [Petrolisthes cinctipes]|uniref:FHA domain-containing protein n=1 Tax=Petrolisthes cinctipes TaxID=88211 RepID=A0AAE1EWF0_PETCI|nr:hypothetical protein Pcinc_031286 [Petrolisthes cinctipes]